ncbi:MAG: hypothetical protein HXS46_09675 [Theionarchaea archaeon]|nr:hypothetical protein [Theionarchaea archaeon]
MFKNSRLNVIRYAIVFLIAGQFGRELIMFNYGPSIVKHISGFTSFQEEFLTAFSFALPLLLVYFGGILADKYGRRLTWAVSLVFLGGSMLWLRMDSSSGMLTTFGPALMVAILLSISSAFGRSPVAWLFDHEGRDGTKNAYGLYFVLFGLLSLAVWKGRFLVEALPEGYINIMLSGLILVMGLWVITFPENYGQRPSSLIEIAKSGVNQFTSSRVLQLIVLQSIFMAFSSFARAFLQLQYIAKEPISFAKLNTFLSAELVIVALCAGILLLLMKKIDYKKLIIYPMIFAVVFYAAIPFAPTMLFFILNSGITFFLFLRAAGIIILANDSISQNRAATLSLLVLFMSLVEFTSSYWQPLFYGLDPVVLSVVAGVCAAGSLGLLYLAVRIHDQKNTLVV